MATDVTKVRAMLGDVYGNIPTSFVLTPYVDAANLVVSEVLGSSDLSASRIDAISTFLACHFTTIALFNGGLVKKTVGNSSETYSTPNGKETGFAVTHWGKQAMALDSTGLLSEESAAAGMLPAEIFIYTGREAYDPNGARSNWLDNC